MTKIGELTIPAFTSSVKITLVTLDDMVLEDDETATLTVNSINSGNSAITGGGSSSITINDTDEAELIFETLDGVGLEDGGALPYDAAFRVMLVKKGTSTQIASDSATTVPYIVKGTSTATSGVDYNALSGSVVIPAFTGLIPGATDGTAIIPVVVKQDTEVEPTETIEAEATTPILGDDDIMLHPTDVSGTISILDNDTAKVSIKSDAASGGDPVAGEPSNNGKFVVLLSAKSATETVVTYEVVPPAPGDAIYGQDYTLSGVTMTTPVITGTVTIPAGEMSATIDLNVINDNVQESDEDVTLKVVSTSNMPQITVDGTMDEAVITITDDDLPTFTVSNAMVTEGTGSGTTTLDILVTLSDPIDVNVQVFLQLFDDTATGSSTLDPTVANKDYINTNTEPQIFPANGTGNDLKRTFKIPINRDNWVEKDEIFKAQLVVAGASIPNTLPDGRPINILDRNDAGYGVATIKDDDTATFKIFAASSNSTDNEDPTVTEGTDAPNPYDDPSPFTNVPFLVWLSNPIDTEVDVDVTFGGGTATGKIFGTKPNATDNTVLDFGTDYDSEKQTVTFTSSESLARSTRSRSTCQWCKT